MRYLDLLVATVSIPSVLATNAVAADFDESKYIQLASVRPLSEADFGVAISSSFTSIESKIEAECVSKGYELNVTCPPAEDGTLCVIERCKLSPSIGYDYKKCACYCNGENTCSEMGYTEETCGTGYVVDDVCPIKSSMVKCAPNPCVGYNYASPCSPSAGYTQTTCLSGTTTKYKCDPNLCTGYVTSCNSGYVLDTSQTCLSGSTTKYKCVVDPCIGYDYTSCSSGYVSGGTCLSGTTTKYKCVADPCTGYYTSCNTGYVLDTSQTCLSGTTTKYKCVAAPCAGYYTSCNAGYVLDTSQTCLSGTTTKYKCIAASCSGYVTSCNSGYVLDTSQTCLSGTTTKYKCVADSCAGYDYTSCSTGYVSAGTCLSGTTTKYKCVAAPCTDYVYTSCPAGYSQSGSCLSGTTWKYKCTCHSDCHSCSDDLSTLPNVSMVTTDAGLRTAVAKPNETVVIMNTNLMSMGGITLASGVKLVGPKYFSSNPLCTSMIEPVYLVMDNVNNAITMTSGAEIHNLRLAYTSTKPQASVINGYGKLKDVAIVSPSETYAVRVPSGTLTTEGIVGIGVGNATDGYTNDAAIKLETGANLYVKGNLLLSGNSSIGAIVGVNSDMIIESTGVLALAGDNFVGIDFEDGSSFIVNGLLSMTGTASSAVGYIQSGDSDAQAIVEFNKAGSRIKASYTGINCNNCNLKINANLNIDMINNISGSPSQHAIKLQTTYSGNYINALIAADVTVTGLNSNTEDELIYADDSTIVNGTITSTTGYGKIMVRGNSTLTLGASSHVKAGSLEAYVSTGKIAANNGAKLEFGGVCKKATSTSTINGQSYITTASSLPITPFGANCSGVTCGFGYYPTTAEAIFNCFVSPYIIVTEPITGCKKCECDSSGGLPCGFI